MDLNETFDGEDVLACMWAIAAALKTYRLTRYFPSRPTVVIDGPVPEKCAIARNNWLRSWGVI